MIDKQSLTSALSACADDRVCLELIKGAPGAVVTLLLGLLAAGIAVKQYRVTRAKLKLDLFEKRFAVFAGTRLFLTEVLTRGYVDLQMLYAFRAATAEVSFLFDVDLETYLRDVDRRALRNHILGVQLRDTPRGAERNKLVDEEAAELTWLTDQLPVLKGKFAPYLGFTTWR